MFRKQPSQQPQPIQPQQPFTQSTFSQSMMIGQINLQCGQKLSDPIVQPKLIPQPQYLCSQCTFQKTVELSQQILGLRGKLAWFERQIREVEELGQGDEIKGKEVLKVMQSAVDREYVSDEQAQRQLKHLVKQLALIQEQLQHQKLLSQQLDHSLKQFIQQNQQLQQQLSDKQSQFYHLTHQYHSQILEKYHTLKQTINLFQTTNFVSILYTITFQNNRSYLNGQKITHENIWKIVEIVLFYQTKYDGHYQPLYHVFWAQMKLQKDPQTVPQDIMSSSVNNLLESINFGSLLRKQSAKQVYIDCDSQQIVLTKWLPCLLLQVKQLFHFVNRQGKKQQKMRYEIGRDGEFEVLKGKTFKSVKDKFGMVVKYLLMDIEQINKIEFFARENRVNSSGGE